MKINYSILITSLLHIKYVNSIIVESNPYHHREVLDTRGNYILEWLVDKPSNTVIFNVTGKTLGYVGLGLTRDGMMMGADLVVGGVDKNGKPYFKDMHVKKNRTLLEDPSQDYKLLGYWQAGGRTSLKFSRLIDTCDENDFKITTSLIKLIWAFGEKDDIGNHFQNRGSFNAYLLDPELTPDLYSSHVFPWKLGRRWKLKPQRTSYICSIHRGPRLTHKHHIIGYRTAFENELARTHTHHLLVYRCVAPEGVDPKAFFEPFTKYEGEECNLIEDRRLPVQNCRTSVAVYGYGGKPFFLPESVGFLVGLSENEYYMFETHYDNAESRSDLEFESAVEFFVTPKLRPRDGGILSVGFDIPGSLAAIPPGSPDFNLIGHCSPNCTAAMAPHTGLDVVAVGPHAHVAARKIRLRQFRGKTELEWIINDENYDPNYQQIRLLEKERKIMPNDHLMTRCNYDNTDSDGTTITGYGTTDEMCLAFIILANNIPYTRCTSEYPARKLLDLFGVDDVIWDLVRHQRIVTSPRQLQGLTLSEVGDYHVKWTEKLREQLEKDITFSPHVTTCPINNVQPSTPQLNPYGAPPLRRIVLQETNTQPFPQGTPPTGVSGLGVAPNTNYPKEATVYRPPSNSCPKQNLFTKKPFKVFGK